MSSTLKRNSFYAVRLEGETEITVGIWDGEGLYPWQIIGSDDIYREEEITVIQRVEVPIKIPCN